jgi:hypothetical protein
MRILITMARFGLGGTESYSVTVAEQLERLGHPTRLHAGSATDGGRELAAARGLRLTTGEPAAIPDLDEIDGAIAQDAVSGYLLAERRDDLPQVFVIHGVAGFEHPPSALRPPPPIVAMNDRIRGRAELLAGGAEVVRLRQPIDVERFRPRSSCRPTARRLLLLGNYVDDGHLRLLGEVCADLGLELVRASTQVAGTVAPELAIADADIVVGYGRSALEGLAMGRATYVWGHAGGDGWITPGSYPRLEADGFSGAATDEIVDRERLRADLAAYSPELGEVGFDLVRTHHSAAKHSESLLRLLGAAEPPRPDDSAQALALLVRSETRWMERAYGAEAHSRTLNEHVENLQAWGSEEAARRETVERELQNLLRSPSWRLTAPLRRLLAALRRRPG